MATAKKTAASKAAPKTEVAVRKTGAVVNIQDQLRQLAEQDQGKTAPVGGNKIRITQDKQFILPDGSKTPGPLQLVIVDFTSRNEYYEGQFDKNNIQPPACFAIGPIPAKLVPSGNSPVKQSDDCASCPMNAFGSKGAGKACKNTRLLAVLPPDADEETPMWTLAVSPTAIRNFDGYVNDVRRLFTSPPLGVVTTVAFSENADYAQLTFTDPQPNDAAGVALSRREEAAALLAEEPDVSSYGQEPARPAGRQPVRPAAKKAVAARR